MAKVENRAAGRPIDPKRVQNAQNALVLAGGNIQAAARATGYQARTIAKYIDKGLIDPSIKVDGAEHLATLESLTANRHDQLADNALSAAEAAIVQVGATLYDANAQQASTIATQMIQNHNLLKGKATSRMDLNVTVDLETLRRHNVLIEATAEEITDAELVDTLE